MNRIFVAGLGAVSPAGWGVAALRDALDKGEPLPVQAMARPGWEKPLPARLVPNPPVRPEAGFAVALLAGAQRQNAEGEIVGKLLQKPDLIVVEAVGLDGGNIQRPERLAAIFLERQRQT